MSIAQFREAGVDLSGLMSVLSKHLYSTPMVAVRELVQNAHDSIKRRQLEDPSLDWQDTACINIIADSQNHLLRIIDTGAGLTEDEIHTYLATVGRGYTRKLREADLAQKAQTGDDDTTDNTGLIGMFGLGFLSAFVLADKVVVHTTSYQDPNQSHTYTSKNAKQYLVEKAPNRPIGTEVIIHLNSEHRHLANHHELTEILSHYCALLSYPIFIHKDSLGNADPINPEPPPWRKDEQGLQAKKSALAFASRFEKHFEPICTMPIQDDDGDLMGMLWVQDGATYGTSDNRNLSVFVRGMLLDDNARELLPSWAGFVGGVIESSKLTPTASREDLQRDDVYHDTAHKLSEALIVGLSVIAKREPEAWRRVLRRHNEALLGAALCDDRLMALLMDSLHITSSKGNLPAQSLVHKGAIHVVLDEQAGFESMLFSALGVAVAEGHRYAIVPFLRRYVAQKGLTLIELGTKHGNNRLFLPQSLPSDVTDWLKQTLCHDESLVVASFAPKELPLVIVPDHEQALKQRLEADAQDKKISEAALRLARNFTKTIEKSEPSKLYVNIDNPFIQKLIAQKDNNPESAIDLLKAIKTLLFYSKTSTDSQGFMSALTSLNDSLEKLLS